MSSTASFTVSQKAEYRALFKSVDADGSGKINESEVKELMSQAGEEVSHQRVQEVIKMVDTNKDSEVDFAEFLKIMHIIKNTGGIGGQSEAMKQLSHSLSSKDARIRKVQGAIGHHSISEEEKEAFAKHINGVLAGDAQLQDRLPIDPTSPTAFFDCCKDGLVFAKLINMVEPGTVDLRAMNSKSAKLNKYQLTENNNLVINAAKAIGCHIVNIGATNLMEGTPYLVLGVTWQIIRKTLLSNISLKNHPELYRLLEEGETLRDLARLPPETILIRWVNFQLARAAAAAGEGTEKRRVTNFGPDLRDSEVYSALLYQLDPARCPPLSSATTDPAARAAQVLENVNAMGIRPFVQPHDIVSGNSKLNLGLMAQIFNANPGLAEKDATKEAELMKQSSFVEDFAALLVDDKASDSREERTFRMWMNSLNLENHEAAAAAAGSSPRKEGEDGDGGTLYINDLHYDLSRGLPILQLMDRIQPGIVPWKKVHRKPKGRIHTVDNCNLVVFLAKKLDLVVVNIGGTDIADTNKTLILAIMWQLMRRFTLDLLKTLGTAGAAVSERDVVAWANHKVAAASAAGHAEKPPPPPPIRNLNDKALAQGTFLLHLCDAVRRGTVDWSLVMSSPGDDEAKALNANYAISVARKIGACVFLTPEDILEVKPKMLFSFIASIWVEALKVGDEPGTPTSSPRPTASPASAAVEEARSPTPSSPPMAPPPPTAANEAAPDAPPPPPPPPSAPMSPPPHVEASAPSPPPTSPPPAPAAPAALVSPEPTSPGSKGFQSVNGSGERGGLYGATSGQQIDEEEPEVEEEEWD